MLQKILVLLSGIIFGLGLVISNMTNPDKVIGFLDIFGLWDPSLIFVMGGAIIVVSPLLYFFKNNKYSLIERHTDVSPILIDLDFKHEPDEDLKRYFTSKNIKDILQLYYEEIRKIFIIKEQSQLIAFIFTRDSPYIYNGVKRDGIHIIFPYIISEPNAQYYLRDCILKRITNEFETCQSFLDCFLIALTKFGLA